jgi:hypothetical protein
MAKLWIIFTAAVLILGFQNCSNGANFEATGDLVLKAESDDSRVIAMTDPSVIDPSIDDANDNDDSTAIVPPTMPPVVDVPQMDDDGAKLEYVCVLRGQGKSVKIAFSNESLSGKKGTPSDVCMSENACLNILSKSFDVAGAEKRGFCPSKSANVISMTDMQIQQALAKAALLKSLNP